MNRPEITIAGDLLADLMQCCEWLQSVSSILRRGDSIDPEFLALLAEQADLVQLWAREYLLEPSTEPSNLN